MRTLKDYAQHDRNCASRDGEWTGDMEEWVLAGNPCDCGLSTLLASEDAQKGEVISRKAHDATVRSLLAELEKRDQELRQRSEDAGQNTGWRPIETAPPDTRWVLLASSDENVTRVGVGHRHHLGTYWNIWNEGGGTSAHTPSHWMPLPSPPSHSSEAVPQTVEIHRDNVLSKVDKLLFGRTDAQTAKQWEKVVEAVAALIEAGRVASLQSEYSEVERNCKGCMGPCGRCHEAALPQQETTQDEEPEIIHRTGPSPMQAIYDDPAWREKYYSGFTKAELVEMLVRRKALLPETHAWQPIATFDGAAHVAVLIGWRDPDGCWQERRAWIDPQFEGVTGDDGETKWTPAWTDDRVYSFGYEEVWSYQPTHWQPLPAPPTEAK